MAAFTLTPLQYGKIVGRFVAEVGDSIDSDSYPDAAPLSGTVTITPSAKKILVPGAAPDPTTAELLPIVGVLDSNGYLTFNGQQGVWVVATDNTATSPNGFTYQVKYALTYNGNVVDSAQFDISVPTASITSPSTWTDLTKVAPAVASGGAVITRGEPGPFTTLAIGTVGTTLDPTAAAVTITPTTDPATKNLNFVIPVGSGGGGGAGTVTKVNGIAPDGTGNVTLNPGIIGAATAGDVVTAQSTASNALSTANSAQSAAASAATAAAAAQTSANGALAAQANLAPKDSPTFTGSPTAPTPATADNDLSVATTAFVRSAIATYAPAAAAGAGNQVYWNATTQAWSQNGATITARPSVVGPVALWSTNDPAATRPSWLSIGDAWVQHPDAP